FEKKQKLSRTQHRFSVSAARSFLFNAGLSQRVKQGNWDAFLPGDLVILDGSNSWFELARLGDDGATRLAAHDIHPSGPLWGQGEPASTADAAVVERSLGRIFIDIAEGLGELGLKQERRALRLSVRALKWQWTEDELYLRFTLAKGGFATTVLGELIYDPQLAYMLPAALRDGIDQLESNT
ncbi:MAG: tRNA pseudouridine(13) synthase TruD, partial [Gammaproteobacteria bacterium]|nr:tRNA pseudouridine(13) synthase TruD [Gammaproteobacteria bacterium]